MISRNCGHNLKFCTLAALGGITQVGSAKAVATRIYGESAWLICPLLGLSQRLFEEMTEGRNGGSCSSGQGLAAPPQVPAKHPRVPRGMGVNATSEPAEQPGILVRPTGAAPRLGRVALMRVPMCDCRGARPLLLKCRSGDPRRDFMYPPNWSVVWFAGNQFAVRHESAGRHMGMVPSWRCREWGKSRSRSSL